MFVSCSREQATHSRSTFYYNEPNGIASLDPALAAYQAAMWAGTQIFNSLVELDSNLKVAPGIAKSWTVDSSACRWIFHLRTDVSFHDDQCFGQARTRRLRASDVQYSIQRILDSKTKSPGLWVFRKRIEGAEEYYQASKLGTQTSCRGIRVIDDSTICFELTEPYAPFLQLLTMPYSWVIPYEAIDRYGQEFGRHPVGTGPFSFDHWSADIELVLKRNTHYFKVDETGYRLPYLEQVHVSFVKDTKTEFLEFRGGRVDLLSSIDPSIASAVVTPEGTLQEAFQKFQLQQACAQTVEYYGILLDTTVAVGKNSALAKSTLLRRALNYAIDRDRIVRYVLNGKGIAATHGVLPPGMPGFSDSIRGYDYNPERARQLLAAAGYPAGKGLPTLTLQMGNSARTVSVGEVIQQMWKEIGVNLEIKQVDFPQHLEMVSSSKLQLWRTSWIGDYPDPENFLALFYSGFCSPNGPNTTHFRDARVDSLYESALSPLNVPSVRNSMYNTIESIVVDESPWIFLYYNVIQRLVQPGISGLPLDGGDRLILERVRKFHSGDQHP